MRQKSGRIRLAWSFLLILNFSTLLIPNMLYAGVYYVATNGVDTNPGTKTSPFKTIKKGVTVLSAGDTLYVRAGTYAETILSWETIIPNGSSWGNPITIAAYPDEIVTINTPSGTAFFWIKDGQDKYLIIDGFIIDGRNVAYHGFKFHQKTRYVRVKNCEIKNSKFSGVLVAGSVGPIDDTYHEFINLHVHHNGSSVKDHGFYIGTGYNLVEYCDIHHNSSDGGKFFSGYYLPGASAGTTARYNILRYNTLHDNSQKSFYPDDPNRIVPGEGWILASGEGNRAYGNISYNQPRGFMIGHGAKNALIYNNIVYNNSDWGIWIHGAWGGSLGAKVFNNTVYNTGKYGILVTDNAQDTIIKNNIAFKNGPDTSRNIWLQPDESPGTEISHNFLADPGFIDVSAHNFKLQPGSPAIDAGLTLQEVLIDFFGVVRAQGIAYDIGAIEQEQGKDNTPPSAPKDLKILTNVE